MGMLLKVNSLLPKRSFVNSQTLEERNKAVQALIEVFIKVSGNSQRSSNSRIKSRWLKQARYAGIPVIHPRILLMGESPTFANPL